MAAKSLHLQVIELSVKNVERSVAWYREMFGLEFFFPSNEGDNEAWLNLNGMGFGLVRSAEIPKFEFLNMKGEQKPIFSFQVDNIRELHEEMIQKGGDVWSGWPKEEDEDPVQK